MGCPDRIGAGPRTGRRARQGRRGGTGGASGTLTAAAQPSDGRSPRPAVIRRLRTAGSAGATTVRAVGSWFNAVLGGQDYQRYVDHLQRNHPGCEIPSEREYWRRRHADADSNPQNRCC
ncbi:YbdD/YjiX family protein [Nocardia sp. CA-119907]|uniref:YbdD/YjiX family protein n=1 Tax=Nocardia sp. CA-119907 TaxID=3239973 RepID=UPI003D9802BA